MEYFELNNGNKLPKICFGPGIAFRGMKKRSGLYRIIDAIDRVKQLRIYESAVISAFKAGATFIDYSAAYRREDIIADALKKAGISRENVYLTTRVTNTSQINNNVRDTALRSIERLKTSYVDLLMFHWPVTDKFVSTWKELIKLKDEGYCKNIGVANCHQHHIEELINATGIKPQVNQVEIHPLFSQKELIKYCQTREIQVEAYTPLARMDERMVRLPLWKTLQAKYNKSISQLVLRWHIQNGVIPVFRSMTPSRVIENFDVFDFQIDQVDMQTIDGININSRLRYDPDNCDFSIL